MSIYVFRIGHLGDTIMSIPAIAMIKKNHVDEDLVLIANNPAKHSYIAAWDILKHTNYFKNVCFYDTASISSLIRFALKIRKIGGKLCYYLPSERSRFQAYRDYAFLKFVCGIREVYGVKESMQPYIVRDGSGNLMEVDKESDRLLKIVCKIYNERFDGYVPKFPLLIPPKEAYERVDELLEGFLLPGDKSALVIGYGSKIRAKIWPLERYAELCKRILDYDKKLKLIFLGGKEDFEAGEHLKELDRNRIINLCGRSNIIESAAILEKSLLYIGNDTGTMHLAAAMGVACVCIFSARDNHGRWNPLGAKNVIIRKTVDCAGCFLEKCTMNKPKCLDDISVAEVLETTIKLLENSNVELH